MKRLNTIVTAVLLICVVLGFAACSDDPAGTPRHPDGDIDSIDFDFNDFDIIFDIDREDRDDNSEIPEIEIEEEIITDGDIDSSEDAENTEDIEAVEVEFVDLHEVEADTVVDGDADPDLPEIDVEESLESDIDGFEESEADAAEDSDMEETVEDSEPEADEIEWPDTVEIGEWDDHLNDTVPDVPEPVCSSDLALLNPGTWLAATPSGLPDIPLAITIVNDTDTWAFRPEWVYGYDETDDVWHLEVYPPEGYLVSGVSRQGVVYAHANVFEEREIGIPEACNTVMYENGCWSCTEDIQIIIKPSYQLNFYPWLSEAGGRMWSRYVPNTMVSFSPGDGNVQINDIELAGAAYAGLPSEAYDSLIASAQVVDSLGYIASMAVIQQQSNDRWQATHIVAFEDNQYRDSVVGHHMGRPVMGGRDGNILLLEDDRADIWYQYNTNGRYSIIRNATDETLYAGGEQVPLVYFDGTTWQELAVPEEVSRTGYTKVVPLGGKEGEQWVTWDHLHMARYRGKTVESYMPMRDLRDLSGEPSYFNQQGYVEIRPGDPGDFAMVVKDPRQMDSAFRGYRYHDRCLEFFPRLRNSDGILCYLRSWTWDPSDGAVYAAAYTYDNSRYLFSFREDAWEEIELNAPYVPEFAGLWTGGGELWAAIQVGTGYYNIVRIENGNISETRYTTESHPFFNFHRLLRKEDGTFVIVGVQYVDHDRSQLVVYQQNESNGFDLLAASGEASFYLSWPFTQQNIHIVDESNIYAVNGEEYCHFDGNDVVSYPLHVPDNAPYTKPRGILPVDDGMLVLFDHHLCLQTLDGNTCIMPPVSRANDQQRIDDMYLPTFSAMLLMEDNRLLVVAWPSLLELVWTEAFDQLPASSAPMCSGEDPEFIPYPGPGNICNVESFALQADCNEGECFIPCNSICMDVWNFYIDQTEVSNRSYRECVEAGVCTDPVEKGPVTLPGYFSDEAFDNYPVVGVTWQQAQDYCVWKGKVLPTGNQWNYATDWAVRGNNQRGLEQCSSMVTSEYWDCVYDRASICHNHGGPVPVDALPLGATASGMLHAHGNVREWARDWVGENSNCTDDGVCIDPMGPAAGQFKGVMGASWADCWTNSPQYPPENASMYIGFRCARPAQ